MRRLVCCLLAAALSAAPARADARRPNFVFVYTDDQRFDALGVVQKEQGDRARFPWLKTPHMDRLAAEGVRFRNMFVVNSLCAPSRASFLTGCYGHVNGVVNNHTPFPEKNITHASLLRAAGYKTAYLGKWHMDGQKGQRPGFDYSASFIGQGRYVDCPFEVNGVPTQTKGWVDDVAADFAVEFLKKHKDGPFSLVVGFKAPHGPFSPPERLKDRFEGETLRPAVNAQAVPPYRRAAPAPPAQPRPGAANARLGYFRCIAAVDDNLGKL